MRAGAALVLLAALAGPARADRAEALFLGRPVEGVTARIGTGGLALPASLFACAGCHGADGRGGEEGALVVPPIVPGEGRAALKAAAILAAVTQGRSAAGTALDRTMPRYAMDAGLATELAGFLAALPGRDGIGVRPGHVRVLVPHDRTGAALAGDFASGLSEAVAGARVWGRQVEVAPWSLDGDPARLDDPALGPLLVAGTAIADPALRASLDASSVVQVAPLVPGEGRTVPLCASWREEIAALVAAAPPGARIDVLGEPGPAAEAAALLGPRAAEDGRGGAALVLSRAPDLLRRAGAHDLVLAPAGVLGPEAGPLAARGVRVILSDRCGALLDGRPADEPPARALGRIAGAAVLELLAGAGRDLGRARLAETAAAARGPLLSPTGSAPRLIELPTGGG